MKKATSLAILISSLNIMNTFAFSDINSNHWAINEIEEFSERKIIAGYKDNTFRPNQNITRAEFAKILVKTFEVDTINNSVNTEFKDINNHWAKNDIKFAVSNNMYDYVLNTDLNPKYIFRPNDFITREEASTMIANYLDLNDSEIDKLNTFTDFDLTSFWAKNSLEGLIEVGLIKGYEEDNTIKAFGNLTRAEAVLLIDRAEEFKIEKVYEKFNKETSVNEINNFFKEAGFIENKNYKFEDSQSDAYFFAGVDNYDASKYISWHGDLDIVNNKEELDATLRVFEQIFSKENAQIMMLSYLNNEVFEGTVENQMVSIDEFGIIVTLIN